MPDSDTAPPTTPESRVATMQPIADGMMKLLNYLYERWQDEGQYEDFKDYETAMRHAMVKVAPQADFIRASKRPFGVTLRLPGFPYDCLLYRTAMTSGWKSVPRT